MDINEMLSRLFLDPEDEVTEFKEAKANFDFSKLGKYFSALSNEAHLKGVSHAWLIFGVKDNRDVVGTQYRKNKSDLNGLKRELAEKLTNRISFLEIFETSYLGKRVVLFQIPAAPKGIPIAFDGHYYGREGESLSPLNLQKIERIRATYLHDWSSEVISGASFEDLDLEAVKKARENYRKKFPDKISEIDAWDDIVFLNKTKVFLKGKVTRTALLLLGKEESDHFLSPSCAKIRWVLKGENNVEKDYEHFSIPFLLAVDKVYAKIRNLKYRYIKEGTLFPEEIQRYEPFVIREAISNCIAHQDYEKGGVINVIEIGDERLVFSNCGHFIPQTVERVVIDDSPEEFYRNRWLVTAMFNLNMVDTVGSGIKKMFNFQRERLFPMPDYNFNDEKVTVTITGKVLNVEFAKALSRNPNLSLVEILILDKIQKGKLVTRDEVDVLKKLRLIEGRKPNYFIASNVVEETKNTVLKAQYIRQRGFDDGYYKKLIFDYIKKFGSTSRKDIDALVFGKLPDVLSKEQKKNKLNNLLGSLRKEGMVYNSGTTNKPRYLCR